MRRPVLLTGAIFAVLAGLLLLNHYGARFVFDHAAAYQGAGSCLVLVCSPYVLLRMKRSQVFAAEFGRRYPTSWLRRWVAMPLSAVAIVAALVAAPLGWLFAVAAWAGGDAERVRAVALEVEPAVERKGCNQPAVLELESVEKETCLDNLNPPPVVRAGQQLGVGIERFSFGFLILSIAPKGREERPTMDTASIGQEQ